LIAALLVIPVILVEQVDPGSPWRQIASVGNWAIWGLFVAEVVVMLAVVPDRWRWIRENPIDVAIVVLTPPFLPASLQALRVFRLLRLLRLVRVIQAARRLFTVEGLRFVALMALLVAFGGGAAFAAVEKDHNANVNGTWDGVYWAITTMTTVGYGDVSPETNYGRIIAIAVMIVGIGFLGLLIGAAAERFVARDIERAEAEVAGEVEESEGEVRAELRSMAARLVELERRLAQR